MSSHSVHTSVPRDPSKLNEIEVRKTTKFVDMPDFLDMLTGAGARRTVRRSSEQMAVTNRLQKCSDSLAPSQAAPASQ